MNTLQKDKVRTHVMHIYIQYVQWCEKVFAPFLISYNFVCLSHLNVSDHETNLNIRQSYQTYMAMFEKVTQPPKARHHAEIQGNSGTNEKQSN